MQDKNDFTTREEESVREKVDRRFTLLKHFLVFVVTNGLLLGVDHGLTTRGDWSYIPLFVWGIVLFVHGLTVVFGDFLADWKENTIQKEIEKRKKM
jgi:hypothetical protein